jgi:hypothetical protein
MVHLLLVNLGVDGEVALLSKVEKLPLVRLFDIDLIHLLPHHLHVSLEELESPLEVILTYTLERFHLVVTGHQLFVELGCQTLELLQHLAVVL